MPMSPRFPGGATQDPSPLRPLGPRRLMAIEGYANNTNLMPLGDFSGGGARRQLSTPGKLVPIGHRRRGRRPDDEDGLDELSQEPPLPDDLVDALGDAVVGLASIGALTDRRASAVMMALERAQDPLACTCALRGIRAGRSSVGQLDIDLPLVRQALTVLRMAYPRNKKYQKTVEDIARGAGVLLDDVDDVDDGVEPMYTGPRARRARGGQEGVRTDGVSVIGLDPSTSVGFVPEGAQGARIRTGGPRDVIDTDGYHTRL